MAERFEPTLDEEATAMSACIMSIYIDSKHGWAGAAMKYCLEEESYISQRIVVRHGLCVRSGYTMLTWKPIDSPKTYVTRFAVIDGLSCDFMLGSKSTDMDYNRPVRTRGHRVSSLPDVDNTPQPEEIPKSPSYVFDDSIPKSDIIGDLILGVAKAMGREPRRYNQYMGPEGNQREQESVLDRDTIGCKTANTPNWRTFRT
jgi:hypothetical protein